MTVKSPGVVRSTSISSGLEDIDDRSTVHIVPSSVIVRSEPSKLAAVISSFASSVSVSVAICVAISVCAVARAASRSSSAPCTSVSPDITVKSPRVVRLISMSSGVPDIADRSITQSVPSSVIVISDPSKLASVISSFASSVSVSVAMCVAMSVCAVARAASRSSSAPCTSVSPDITVKSPRVVSGTSMSFCVVPPSPQKR